MHSTLYRRFTRSACPGAADTSILECNLLLQDTLNFDVAEDIPEQRTALVEFFNSTGGQDWSVGIAGTQTRIQIADFQGYILQIGQLAAQASFDPANLPADVQSVYYTVQQLSTNCRLQRSLQLINLLGKVAWNTASELSHLSPRNQCGTELHLLPGMLPLKLMHMALAFAIVLL